MATFDSTTSTDGLQDKLVSVRRTAKVVKGGRIFGFSAVTVVGDGAGRIGVGKGKSKEVPVAIQKALEAARKNMVDVNLNGNTLFHEMTFSHGSSTVFMKPASEGTGIIAGGAVRAVFELAGVHDILSKSIGTSTPINMLRATFAGLRELRTPEQVAKLRGVDISRVS